MSGELSARVTALCEEGVARLGPPLADEAGEIAIGLREPLRVAVVGRVNAGKSTLVNALVRRRIAPTDVSECTEIVTWFRYGAPDRVDAVLKDGRRITQRLGSDGRLPTSLGWPLSDVDHLDVWLTNATLRSMTIIDTPGLASLQSACSARTQSLLGVDQGLRAAAAQADGILFVFNQALKSDELEVLREFHQGSGAPRLRAVNTLGVLSKADKIGDDTGDPCSAAKTLAAAHARALAGDVSMVVPVAGLLAETVQAGAFTEADAAVLADLAASPPLTRERLVMSTDDFVSLPATVPAPKRADLLNRLDLYGIRLAFAAIDAGEVGAASLMLKLGRASGFQEVHEAVHTTFGRRSDAIKAASALSRLEQMAFWPGVRTEDRWWVTDSVEELRLEPQMHELLELDAFVEVTAGRVSLPPALAAELRRFTTLDEPDEKLGLPGASRERLVTAALDAARRWKLFAFGAPPHEYRVAQILHRSHQLLWERLVDADGGIRGQ